MKAELDRRLSHLDKVEALFRQYPGEWIAARDFEIPGGRQAWRSRIAECRTKRQMHIENRQDRDSANCVIGSWYRWLPHGKPLGRDPATPAPSQDKHPAVQVSLPLRENV